MNATLTSPAKTPGQPLVPPTFASQSSLEAAILAALESGPCQTRVYVIAGLKGGLGKTTSAMGLAFSFHRKGLTVAVVDADALSQTARTWAADCESNEDEEPLPFQVIGYAMTGLAEYIVNNLMGKVDVVIVDTGADGERLMRDACRVADDLIMVMGPDDADLKRLPATWSTAHLVAAETGRVFTAHVLLVRCPTSSTMKDKAVADLAKVGITPLRTVVPQAVMYRRMSGTNPKELGAYTVVAEELTGEEYAA